jgi:hypothetical protein
MDVDVEVEGAPEPLEHGHTATAAVADAARPRPRAQVAFHGAVEEARHRAAQVVAPRQQIAQPVWQGEDPLPHGDIREDVVHEVRRALGHPPAAATGAEAAPLAGERDQPLGPAGVAPEPGEAAGKEAAAQERIELRLDEPRQPLTVAQACRFDAKVSTCSRTTV